MIEEYYEDLCIVKQAKQMNAFGGNNTYYVDDTHFRGAVSVVASSNERVIGDKPALVRTYNVATPIGTGLKQGDLVKRVTTGQIIRITSDSEVPPLPSMLNFELNFAEAVQV